MDLKSLISQWNSVEMVPNGFKQIDENHPLKWFIGYDDALCRALRLTTEGVIKFVKPSRAVSITQITGMNNKNNLVISLLDSKLQDVFFQMIIDLLGFSSKGKTSDEALSLFLRRFQQWEKLFKRGLNDVLSAEQQRGLIGELIHLKELLEIKNISKKEIVAGWVGPEDEHQDFQYPDEWVEVKTVLEAGEKIKISSLEQLSPAGNGKLRINFLRSSVAAGCFSLNGLVAYIRDFVDVDEAAAELFEIKLTMAGYVTREEYGEKTYQSVKTSFYSVRDDFPRIKADDLPVAVLSASYVLSIPALEEWRI